MTLEPGTLIGPYEIVTRLGAGGMGEVYSARDTRLERTVAIKVLHRDAAQDQVRLQRFLAEAKVVSSLNHPNILTLHEIGESEGGPYLVTELVEGTTIRELLADGPLEIHRALDYAIQVAEGLAKAQGMGVVHRDLKPENIMVTDDGFAKVLDFGLAKLRPSEDLDFGLAPNLTATGTLVGTLGYISPEQLHGEEAGFKSDLFALGVVLFEMLSGKNPFQRESSAATLSAIVLASTPDITRLRPEVPPELASTLKRVLAKDPADRHAHVLEFAAELRSVRAMLESGSLAAPRVPRRRRLFGLAGLAGVTVGVLVILVARFGSSPAFFSLPEDKTAVAVIPIQDASGDPDLARADIGRVLTDGLVRILADIPGVYVVSPVRLRGVASSRGQPLEEAGRDVEFGLAVSREAQAEAMLSGILSKVGDTFILDASLVELPDADLLGTFRARSTDRSRILQDLTESMGLEIHRKLGTSEPEGSGAIDRVATGSLEAYTSFVRGRDYMEQGQWEDAVPELKRAIGLDEDMGLAWSLLACAYSFAGDEASSQAAQKRAEELIEHVNHKERRWIQLNGTWVNSGSGSRYREEAEAFIRDFPDDREGYYYAGLGAEYLEDNCEDALVYYEKAYRLTPSFYAVTLSLAECNMKLGRRGTAIRVLERYLALPMIGMRGREQAEAKLAELQQGL